jgi:hypothetical protein
MAEVRGSSPLSSIGAEPRSDAGSDDTDGHPGQMPKAAYMAVVANPCQTRKPSAPSVSMSV